LTESRAPITGSDSVEATADLDIILDMPTFPLLSPLLSIDDSGQFSDVDSPTHEHGRDPELRQREQIHPTSSSKPSKPHHRRPGGDDRPSHFSHRDDRRRGNVARDESVEPSRNELLLIHADLSLTTTSSVMVVIETSRETDLMASEDVTVTIVPAIRIDGKDRLCRTTLFLLFSRLDYWSSLICRDDLR